MGAGYHRGQHRVGHPTHQGLLYSFMVLLGRLVCDHPSFLGGGFDNGHGRVLTGAVGNLLIEFRHALTLPRVRFQALIAELHSGLNELLMMGIPLLERWRCAWPAAH